jgi:hypothetical protein
MNRRVRLTAMLELDVLKASLSEQDQHWFQRLLVGSKNPDVCNRSVDVIGPQWKDRF